MVPAITELKAEGKCPPDTVHRQVKYLNNIIEADHGKLKRLINPVRGFKSMKTALLKGNSISIAHNQSDQGHSSGLSFFFCNRAIIATLEKKGVYFSYTLPHNFLFFMALKTRRIKMGKVTKQKEMVSVKWYQIITVHTDEGVIFRRYHHLSSEEQRRIDLGVATAYRELIKTRAADTSGDLGAEPTVQELSCGIDAHHGGGGTISVGCSHGFYWCVVSISGDEGISAQCGKDTPTPATPG